MSAPWRYEWKCPRLTGHELGLAGWSMDEVHTILGIRFHNPVEMSVSQRENGLVDADTHPCA